MSRQATPFPFRSLLGGKMRTMTKEQVEDTAGPAEVIEGDVWIYRMGRNVPDGTIGDPRSVEVQFMFHDDCVAHAWMRMVFADGLDYQEVLH